MNNFYDPNYAGYGGYNPGYYGPSNQRQLRQYAFVNGIEGAKSYQVNPNTSMMLMDADHSICYMKTANEMGKASLRYFKLEEIDENMARDITQPKPQPAPEVSTKSSEIEEMKRYFEETRKAEMDALNKRIDELTKKIEKNLKREPKDNG